MIAPIPIPKHVVDLSTRPPLDAATAQRGILQIRLGTRAFEKVVLEPRTMLTVGRDEGCDLSLPADRELSSTHFEIDWDGARSELRDRRSRTGTLVGGKPVISQWLENGDWVRAGGTDFSFHIEASTPPLGRPRGASLESKRRALEELQAERARDDVSLWGIVDAARNDRVLTLLQESVEEHRSLYEGLPGAALDRVAPYTVRFRRDSELLDRLIHEGWGDAWAVFFTSRETPKEVRRHLRRFLLVEEEDTKKRLYFRYYDPRVLRDFMAIATPRQKSELTSNLERFLFEDAAGSLVTVDAPSFDPTSGGSEA